MDAGFRFAGKCATVLQGDLLGGEQLADLCLVNRTGAREAADNRDVHAIHTLETIFIISCKLELQIVYLKHQSRPIYYNASNAKPMHLHLLWKPCPI